MAQSFTRDIGTRVHKLACLMGRSAEQTLRTVGNLTFSQSRILMALLHGATLNQRTIAQYHGLTEAAVSRMLTTMQRQKLVRLVNDPTNRRTHQLTLTPRGKRVAEKATTMLENQFTKAFHGISLHQRNSFLATIDSLINGLAAE
jgi:DNA-binding MarR family transcriptional regulator